MLRSSVLPLANYKDEVALHSTFYAVPQRVIEEIKAQAPQEKNMKRGDTRNLSTVQFVRLLCRSSQVEPT